MRAESAAEKRIILFPAKFVWVVTGLFVLLALQTGCERTPQDNRNMVTIGIVNLNSRLDPVIESFKSSLKNWGFQEGQNCTILYDGPLSTQAQVDDRLQELVHSRVNLIYTLTTPVTQKAKEATEGTGIPVLFAPLFAPVGSGIVDSLVKPGGNLTGIKIRGGTDKALEWFLKIAPHIKNIYLPFHYTDQAANQSLEDLEKAAAHLGVRVLAGKVDSEAALIAAMNQIPEEADAVWITHSHLIVANIQAITGPAIARKLPVASTIALRDGILVSYATNLEKLGEQAAQMADKLLRGIPASDIPVETTDYYLGIDLRVAQAIDLEIPESILSQADIIKR